MSKLEERAEQLLNEIILHAYDWDGVEEVKQKIVEALRAERQQVLRERGAIHEIRANWPLK